MPAHTIVLLIAGKCDSERGTHTLEDVPVLIKSLLGQVRLLKVHAQLQVLEHDGLKQLLGVGVAHLTALDNLIKDLEGPVGFPHIDEL